MSDLDLWLVIALLTLATLITRSGFWLVGQHINLPKRVLEALRFAPACALAAILVPDFLTNQHHIDISISNQQLVAGILASVFFLYKRNMFLTIFFGMGVFTLVRLYL